MIGMMTTGTMINIQKADSVISLFFNEEKKRISLFTERLLVYSMSDDREVRGSV